ncbi:hypothetical protein LTR37_001888 [Vermiconidia calcicola]|uniref:Uncharacterized protein n=1 Tax=Vermiconidia calcicola TaxID=1690605 RepID=A0ACC3NUY6_9PEZI|nr:hypothetical protein LTR37_001888 [Vermiconidia calcicola]
MTSDHSLVRPTNIDIISPSGQESDACAFLALPAELRVIIYRSLFEDISGEGGTIDLNAIELSALVQTSRQLQAEVLPILAAVLQDKPWIFRFPKGSFEPTRSRFTSQSSQAWKKDSNVLARLHSLFEAFTIASLNPIKAKKFSLTSTGNYGSKGWTNLGRQTAYWFERFGRSIEVIVQAGGGCSVALERVPTFDWLEQPQKRTDRRLVYPASFAFIDTELLSDLQAYRTTTGFTI